MDSVIIDSRKGEVLLHRISNTSEWDPHEHKVAFRFQNKKSEGIPESDKGKHEDNEAFLEQELDTSGYDEWLPCGYDLQEMENNLIEYFNKHQNITENNYVLLAAENGDYKMLKLFVQLENENIKIRISRRTEESGNDLNDAVKQRNVDTDPIQCYVSDNLFNFRALGKEEENILHLILKRPLLTHRKKYAGEKKDSDGFEKIQGLVNYMTCMNVILDKKNGIKKKLLYELVNQQDRKGNTPLHYAIKSWPPKIMKRLLELGADIGLENHNKEDSMSKISPKVLQNYLDTTCVELDDSHLKCEDFIKYKKSHNEDNGLLDILEENEPTFMDNINENAPITFDFKCLVPTKTSDSEGLPENKNSKLHSKRTYEMDILQKLSIKHEDLLTHPVVRFFIWLKWCYIRKYVIRHLKFQLLISICITWYFVNKQIQEKDSGCYFGFLTSLVSLLCGNISVHSKNQNETDIYFSCNKESDPYLSCYQYCSLGYMIFFLYFLFQLFFFCTSTYIKIIFTSFLKRKHPSNISISFQKAGGGVTSFSTIVCGLYDLANVLIPLLIVIRGKCLLEWVMIVFFVIKSLLTIIKVLSSWDQGQKTYHCYAILLNVMIGILLFDSAKFGSKFLFDSVKKSLTAMIIFFIWYEWIAKFLLHTSYNNRFAERYQIYMTMLKTVSRSFLKLLFLYSFFFIIFGFGFNILFQSEITVGARTVPEDQHLYKNQLSSIVKTFIMLSGEMDFDDMPIDVTGMQNKPFLDYLGVLLAFSFVILFVFMVVIVLMNLLNAIAIRDAREIIKNSNVLQESERVEVLAYFENIFLELAGKRCLGRLGKKIEWYLCREINLFHTKEDPAKKTVEVFQLNDDNLLTINCCDEKTTCSYNKERKKVKIKDTYTDILNETKKLLIERNKFEVDGCKKHLEKQKDGEF